MSVRLTFPSSSLSLIDVLVDEVEARRVRAVHLVPPVADEMALIEEGPHGAEERVRAAVVLAHVEDLECEREEDFIRCYVIVKKTTERSSSSLSPDNLPLHRRTTRGTACRST